MDSSLESTVATMREVMVPFSSTYEEMYAKLANDLSEVLDELRKKTKECRSIVAKGGQLENVLAIFRNVPDITHKKIEKLEPQLSLDIKTKRIII